jgi:hypothetical protein
MNPQTISQDDTSADLVDNFGDEFPYRLPDEVRDSLTNHFLALMGAEPLRPEERLAA